MKARRGKPWFFLTHSSFTLPGTIYRYDSASENSKQVCTVFWEGKVEGLTPQDFLTEQVGLGFETNWWSSLNTTSLQVWYSSKDGTRIPMFLIRHKDTALDGTAPVLQWGTYLLIFQYYLKENVDSTPLLSGYGGFAVSAEPEFKSPNLTFIQRYGAVLAIPNIRGGGEFGIQWHEAAMKERKVLRYLKMVLQLLNCV